MVCKYDLNVNVKLKKNSLLPTTSNLLNSLTLFSLYKYCKHFQTHNLNHLLYAKHIFAAHTSLLTALTNPAPHCSPCRQHNQSFPLMARENLILSLLSSKHHSKASTYLKNRVQALILEHLLCPALD